MDTQTQQQETDLKANIFTQYFKLVAICWRYAKGHRVEFVAFIAMCIVANIIFMCNPYVVGQIINTLQIGGDNLLHDVTNWLLLYVGVSVAFWMFHGPSRVIERMVAYYVKNAFSLHYYEMLTRLPLRWHNDHHTGNTTNRINKASYSLLIFGEHQFMIIQSTVHFVLIFVLVALLDPVMSSIMFVLTIGTFIIMVQFDKVIMRYAHQVNEKEHIFASYFFDYVSNMANVVMFNMRRLTQGQLGRTLGAQYAPRFSEAKVVEYKWFVRMLAIYSIQFIVLYSYITMNLDSGEPLMLGTLVMLFQYLIRLDSVFVTFAQVYEQIVRYYTDVQAVAPIENDYNAIGVEDDHHENLEVSQGAIEIKDLAFSYQNGDNVFDKLTLSIPPNQRVGLIGSSGAGKTSLVSLLMRFYDVDSGSICIDGQNISEVSSASLRDAIAVIPQDTTLFEVSLMENIRYGRMDASEEEVKEAARQAYADEFIQAMPDGYHTMVGERGVKLSGGQRQRVAIARAILKDAPILILDEATSALDSESERYIQDSLHEMMKGKTVIAIAHRLSTIASLDRLIVMDQGKIVEDGTHKTLLKKEGHYAKLWSMQSGGFLKE